jgi:hypothetical protein
VENGQIKEKQPVRHSARWWQKTRVAQGDLVQCAARAILCFTLYISTADAFDSSSYENKSDYFFLYCDRETSRWCFQNNEIVKRLHIIGFLSDYNSFVVARSRPLFFSSPAGIQSKSAIVNFSPRAIYSFDKLF